MHFFRIFLLFFPLVMFAQDHVVCHLSDHGGRYREHNFDADSLFLDLSFDTKNGKVFGKESLVFSTLHPTIDSIFLDAPNIKIKNVSIIQSDVKVTFSTSEIGLAIYFSPPLQWQNSYSLEIDFESQPRKGLYFIGWNDDRNISRKQVWTQGQGIDNRHWFPCYDDVNDKLITSTRIRFDSEYTVVSNGSLLSKINNPDKTTTWHYAMDKPHVPYLLMLAIDKFDYKDYISKNGMISRQYFYSDMPQTVDATYAYSDTMMDWMEKELGVNYPWKTYANVPVQDFMYGAMENTTATIFGDFYLNDQRGSMERAYLSTNAHELTHQWFGDLVTEWSATHHWLHESFATYYAKLFSAYVYGDEYHQMSRFNEAQSAIAADDKDRYPVAHSKGGSARHYPKGSFVIGMLREWLGDDIFKKCIQHFLLNHAFDNVDSHDFFISFMKKSGINIDWFLDQWIYKSGYPILEVKKWESQNLLYFNIQQTQKRDSLLGIFKFPLDVDIYWKDKSVSRHRIFIKDISDTLVLNVDTENKFDFAVIDPEYKLLKRLTYKRNIEEIFNQAQNAQHMIARYVAFKELENIDSDTKREIFKSTYAKEKSHYIKEEILSQWAKDNHPTIEKIKLQALSDKHFKVRRAALVSLKEIKRSHLNQVRTLLSDSSYNNISLALEKLVEAFPKERNQFLDMTKNTMGIAKNVRIEWLRLQLKSNSSKVFYDELVDYISPSYEFRTRINAMNAISELNIFDASIAEHLVQATSSPNRRLSGQALGVLKKYYKDETYKSQILKALSSLTGLDWQKDMVKAIKLD